MLAAACGLPSVEQRPAVYTEGAAAWVERQGQELRLVVAAREGEGPPRPVAVLEGVRLLLGEEGGAAEYRLSFSEVHRQGEALWLSCPEQAHHRLRVQVATTPDGLEVRLEDRIGLESRIRTVALDYRLQSPVVTGLWLPRVPASPRGWVPDRDWDLPLAWLQGEAIALGLEPEVDRLTSDRPLPQALRADPSSGTIGHGLVAGKGVAVQGAVLRLSHRLHPFSGAGAGAGSRQALTSAIWQRRIAFLCQRSSTPLQEPFATVANRVFGAELPAHWREMDLAGRRAAAAAPGRSAPGDPLPADAWFTAEANQLQIALGLLQHAERTGQPGLQQRAVELLDLLLQAPRRAGVFPALVAFDPETGRIEVEAAGTGPGSVPGHHRTADTAMTGLWLLELARRLPGRREEILTACRPVVRFLLSNQLDSGAWPAHFEERFLAPRREPLYDAGLESAGPALFLARFAEREEDPRALAAAWRALRFLGERLDAGDFRDAVEVGAAGATVRPGIAVRPAGTTGLALTAELAWHLARRARGAGDADRAAEARARAEQCLAALAGRQRVWQPRWAPDAVIGAVPAHNLAGAESGSSIVLAANAWLSGYEQTGHREYLQRAAMALRAALAAGADPERRLLRWVAAAAFESCYQRLGQALVDLGGRFAEGLDALWASGLQVQPGEIRLGLWTMADGLEQALVRFANVPPSGSYRVVVSDRGFEPLTAEDLQRGVRLPVRRLPALRFAPPAEIAITDSFQPHVRWTGPWPADARAFLEVWRDGDRLEEIELVAGEEPGRLLARQGFSPRGLSPGDTLDLRLRLAVGNADWYEPVRGFHRVQLSASHCIDPGDDDEHLLVDPGPSAIAWFADGRQGCRLLPAGGSATWEVPVATGAAKLELSLELAGGVRARSGGVLLYEDPGAVAGVRRLGLELADPRLWPGGRFPLTLTAVGGPLEVARIRYRTAGGAADLPIGHGQSARRRAGTLRVVVVPLDLADVSRRSSAEEIRQACFGGPEYRLTPSPESRRTAGSAATLASAMSGGLSNLVGAVVEPLAADVLASELARQPDHGRATLRRLLLEHLESLGTGGEAVDFVLAVHGRNDHLAPLSRPTAGEPPVLFLPDREADGSLLASGTILASLLRAGFDLIDLRGPDGGAFGELALGSTRNPHIPPGPIGLHLEQIGWADRIALRPEGSGLSSVPVLQIDRAFLTLLASELPGRGDLVLEERREGSGEPGLGAGGSLLYWDLRSAPPTVGGEGGAAARPRLLRLSPRSEARPTPFHPGTDADLLRGAEVLGPESLPALVTPQGEAAWTAELRTAPSGRRTVRLRENLRRSLAWSRAAWTTTAPGRPPAPLPWNTPLPDTGQVGPAAQGLRLLPHPRPGGRVAGSLPLPDLGAPLRLFCHLQAGAGPVVVSLGADGQELLAAEVGTEETWLHLDLPPPQPDRQPRLWLQVESRADGPAPVRFDRFFLVPRQPALPVLPGAHTHPAAEPWADGHYHSEVLRLVCGRDGEARARTPIALPAGRGRLRLLAGMPASVPAGTRLTLSVTAWNRDRSWQAELLAEHELVRGEGRQPMFTALLELPPAGAERLAFVELSLRGPEGAGLHFQTIEIAP